MKYEINKKMSVLIYAILSMLPYLIGILIIAPFQDVFYGGDDWAYAWSVLNLAESSMFEASDWATAQAVPQILWGALFVKIFGWSISVLNISTIVASFFAGLAFFYMVVALGFRNNTALLATIVITVSPIYLGMSLSFMTDSMFTSLTLITSACYVRAILNKSIFFAILGGLFCGAALLERQFGIVLLIAYVLTSLFWYFTSEEFQSKKDVFKIATLGVALPILMFSVSLIYPDIIGGKTIAQAYVIDTTEAIMRLLHIPKLLIKSLITYDYLIVLLCPMFIPFLFSEREKLRYLLDNRWLLAFISLTLIAGPMVWYVSFGTGVQGDVFQVNSKYGNNEIWSEQIWMGLLLLCTIPGTLLVAKIWQLVQPLFNTSALAVIVKKTNSNSSAIAMMFIALCTVGLIILTSSHLSFYNNYFLPILPFLAICILFILRDHNQHILVSSIMTSAFFITSVLYTESTVRYVEASWKEADTLVLSGETATTIFPWPAWYGWQNTNEVHEYMRRKVDEGSFPMNVIGQAYDDAQIYIIGSTDHPLYNESTSRSVPYDTLIRSRELWVLQKGYE